jgi:phage tail sheath protein FI
VRTITGVPTSIAAFLGRTKYGPVNESVTVTTFGDFERTFGGLWKSSPMTYAVRDFFLNGGAQAVIVRLFNGDPAANTATLAIGDLKLQAKNPGAWGSNLIATIDKDGIDGEVAARYGVSEQELFNLTVVELAEPVKDRSKFDIRRAKVARREVFRALTAKKIHTGPRRFDRVLNASSSLVSAVKDQFPGDAWDPVSVMIPPPASPATPGAPPGTTPPATPGTTPAATSGGTPPVPTGTTPPATSGATPPGTPGATPVTTAPATPGTSPPAVLSGGTSGTAPAATVTPPAGSSASSGTGAAVGGSAGAASATPSTSGGSPSATVTQPPKSSAISWASLTGATADGGALNVKSFLGDSNAGDRYRDDKLGLFALERTDIFNLLCIPPEAEESDTDATVLDEALQYCVRRRAMLMVDPPHAWANSDNEFRDLTDNPGVKFTDLNLAGEAARNAALFFPRLHMPDPLMDNQNVVRVPCGVMAGVFSRTDVTRGVWKAPAGIDANLVGVRNFQRNLTDAENGLLNPYGINCLRAFPVYGRVSWGARTARGADALADEYKYIPIRRLALFLEESLYRGLKWAVFEPNDEPLWGQIRLNVGAFMNNLFRRGAFAGRTKQDAYYVKCDADTTTQNDRNLGIVNVVVGFAPLKPAEFVVLKVQQIVSNIET